jgi:hypothetical protein
MSLAVSGGLAGGLRLGRPPVVVDLSTLTDADARELTGLLSAARAEPSPESPRRFPDEQSYTVTVDDGLEEGQVLRRSDSTMSQAFAELLTRLQRLAAGSMG